MSDPLIGPKLKIERAKHHFDEVCKLMEEFAPTYIYKIVTKPDPNGTHEWFVAIRPDTEVNGMVPVVVAEIIYSLRSSLDQLTCALARANGATDLDGVYFPFEGDETKFKSKGGQGKIQALHKDAIDAISALKPYKGGDDFLWSLNRISNIDKHKTILDVGAMMAQYSGSALMAPGTTEPLTFHMPKTIANPFDKEIRLLSYPLVGSKPAGNFQIGIDIVFRNVDVVDGRPVDETLSRYINMVDGIVKSFDCSKFLQPNGP